MKKIVLVILILLVALSVFGADNRRVKAIGDFYARMPQADAFALVGDRELIESYSGVDYTFYDFGDIKLYISEGVLTGVKLYELDYKLFGFGIGDLFDRDNRRLIYSNFGYSMTNFGGEYAVDYTGVRFFIGSRIYSSNMPIDIIYAIEIHF